MTDPITRLNTALEGLYVIERVLGVGGMATVYLAQDVKHDRKVAIKVLRPDLAASLGPERFLGEVRVTANLQHPHILPLFDSGQADDFLYYVMPFIEGETLRDRLVRERELPVPEAARLLHDIADALAAAHAMGVVHRDVKPENVLLSGRHAMIADFGVARAVRAAAGADQLTTVGVALGTPAYMAPEQAAADDNIDHRADIYAFGAVAYELLTGSPPFTGKTQQQVLAAQVTETPRPVTEARPSVPPGLAAVVMRCLEKKPADRWQSAEDLLPHLVAASTPSGGITPTDLVPAQVPSKLRRNTAIAVGVTAVVVVAALAGAFLRPTGNSLVADRVMVAVFENGTGDASLNAVGKIAADVLARGLQEIQLVEIVDPRATLEAASPEADISAVAANRALAEQLGAATLVTGEYLRLGDSLRFQAQVMETESGAVVESLAPVMAGVANPMSGIERLNQGVMAVLANMFSAEFAGLGEITSPGSYDAYREFITARELFAQFEFERSAMHLQRSLAADPNFVLARLYLGGIMQGIGRYAATDSIVRSLSEDRDRLTAVERYTLDWLQAVVDGDPVRAHRALTRGLELVPTSPEFGWTAGGTANAINRPREALDIVSNLDPDDPLFGTPDMLWFEITEAHHLLAEHEAELVAALRAREQFPQRLDALRLQAYALAALGNLEDVAALLDEALTLPVDGGFTPANVLSITATELRAHGHIEAADAFLQRAIDWYVARPGEYESALGEALRWAGRWESAKDVYEDLAESFPDSYWMDGALGVIAAHLGEREEALRLEAKLAGVDEPYVFGGPDLWRARIVAALGERERAVNLLRDAFTNGLEYGYWLHRDVDLSPLWDYPAFQELLRPKG